MTRNEKKTAIENMAERFMSISDLEGKSMAIMVMSAYAEARQQEKSRSVADGNRKRRLQRPPNRTRKQQARAFLIDWRCSR